MSDFMGTSFGSTARICVADWKKKVTLLCLPEKGYFTKACALGA